MIATIVSVLVILTIIVGFIIKTFVDYFIGTVVLALGWILLFVVAAFMPCIIELDRPKPKD